MATIKELIRTDQLEESVSVIMNWTPRRNFLIMNMMVTYIK